MPRQPLTVRDAVPDDAAELVSLWLDAGYPVEPPRCETTEFGQIIAEIAADPDQRIVVGVHESRVVAALHMRRSMIGPLSREDAVHTSYLAVLPDCRRHGYARVLLEAAVSWAEAKDTPRITAITNSASRDTNRFLARLGLGTIATVRVAPTTGLRMRLNPAPRNGRSRAVGRILAERRRHPAKPA
jgi:GNAT superfamily N-acetyltransferase